MFADRVRSLYNAMNLELSGWLPSAPPCSSYSSKTKRCYIIIAEVSARFVNLYIRAARSFARSEPCTAIVHAAAKQQAFREPLGNPTDRPRAAPTIVCLYACRTFTALCVKSTGRDPMRRRRRPIYLPAARNRNSFAVCVLQ